MLRQARVSDVPAIHVLIDAYADKGVMLPRARARIYETVRDFLVAEEDGRLVAVGALRTLWEDLGEICSVAVAESHQRKGIGTALTKALLKQAWPLGLKRILVLTYIPEFFRNLGFRDIPKSDLPHKVWAECVSCPKFPDCGELALVRELE